MSSSDRRAFLALLLAMPLAGCGFTPVLAPGAPATKLTGRIEADPPVDRDTFMFVAEFETLLGRPQAPTYRLAYSVTVQRYDLAVTTSGSILRYNYAGKASWTLTDIRTGATLTSGTAESFTGSAATTSTIAAKTAEDNARKRLMQILAAQIATRLNATADDWATQ